MDKDLDQILSSYKGKKVAFFHSHILWSSHFETELELIELFQKNDAEIISYICDDVLGTCDQTIKFDMFTCSSCIKRRKTGLSLVGKTKQIKIQLNKSINHYNLSPDISISDLVQLKHNNFDFGYASLSSMIHRTRDPYIKISDHFTEFKNFINISISLYEFYLDSLKKDKPDLIIIFNGRFAYTRALLRAAEYLKIEFYTHERGANKDKFMLFKNTMPHNLDYFHESILREWSKSLPSLEIKKNIAEDFYINRRNGKPQDWVSFITKQQKNLLPEKFNPSNYNIGIFMSSEDEFSAIGDSWKRPFFNSQVEGLKFLFRESYIEDNIHFYIRMHPNSSKLQSFIDEINQFSSNNITIIEPLSPISSYDLLDNVDKVITFGSTIGIEGAFWGKPVINLDNAFYFNLDVCYNPLSKESIIDLVKNKNLVPKPKENIYPYGYYFSVFGYDYNIYKPQNFESGTYKNVNLNYIQGVKKRDVKGIKYISYKTLQNINTIFNRIEYFLNKIKP